MSRIFRDILVAVIGGVVTFVILTMIAKRKQTDSVGGKAIKALATSEAINMLRSSEGKTFVQTPEFRDLTKALTTAKAEKLLGFIG